MLPESSHGSWRACKLCAMVATWTTQPRAARQHNSTHSLSPVYHTGVNAHDTCAPCHPSWQLVGRLEQSIGPGPHGRHAPLHVRAKEMAAAVSLFGEEVPSLQRQLATAQALGAAAERRAAVAEMVANAHMAGLESHAAHAPLDMKQLVREGWGLMCMGVVLVGVLLQRGQSSVCVLVGLLQFRNAS